MVFFSYLQEDGKEGGRREEGREGKDERGGRKGERTVKQHCKTMPSNSHLGFQDRSVFVCFHRYHDNDWKRKRERRGDRMNGGKGGGGRKELSI